MIAGFTMRQLVSNQGGMSAGRDERLSSRLYRLGSPALLGSETVIDLTSCRDCRSIQHVWFTGRLLGSLEDFTSKGRTEK